MKQYKFKSRSALSFAVAHNGRQMYVNFSPAYRGLSFYITTDPSLAEKIRKHRWFREGRIHEEVVEIQPAMEAKPYQPAMPQEPKKYSILGKSMSTAIPKPHDVVAESAQQATSTVAAVTISPDEVSSFMEAKEFFIANYGLQRSDVANKEAVAALCKEFGVVFPNYPL